MTGPLSSPDRCPHQTAVPPIGLVGRAEPHYAPLRIFLLVRRPRRRKPASYAAHFVTLRLCFGMWWRHLALALKGTAAIRGQDRDRLSTRSYPRTLDIGSVHQRHTSS